MTGRVVKVERTLCSIGFTDWTLRNHCDRMAACEVRVIRCGYASAWRLACYRHADILFEAIAKADREVWDVQMRPDAVLREVLEHKAEVITLDGWPEQGDGEDDDA